MVPKVNSTVFADLDCAAKKSCIIVEDIIHITKKEEQKLRIAINYQAHHKTQKIICASHSIYKTQIFSLLGFFNFIIFTSAIANIPTLRNILNFFKIEKPEIERLLGLYTELGQGKKGIYFYFDFEKMTFNISKKMLFRLCKSLGDPEGNIAERRATNSGANAKNLQTIFLKFVENFCEKNEAVAIFSVISNCVPNSLIREEDLTITFREKQKKKKMISIVDYVISILSPKLIVSPPLIVMHRFIQKYCIIPRVFIRNKAFW